MQSRGARKKGQTAPGGSILREKFRPPFVASRKYPVKKEQVRDFLNHVQRLAARTGISRSLLPACNLKENPQEFVVLAQRLTTYKWKKLSSVPPRSPTQRLLRTNLTVPNQRCLSRTAGSSGAARVNDRAPSRGRYIRSG